MRETAAFKFESLPDWTFAITRYTSPESDRHGNHAAGDLRIDYHQDGENRGGGTVSGPRGSPDIDKPFVPGGRITFTFRSLPGYTFWANRSERQASTRNAATGETLTVPEGWLRIGYTRDGEEDVELCAQGGPREDGGFGPRVDELGRPTPYPD